MKSGHPTEVELALYAGGDCGFWQRRTIGAHLRTCASCRREVGLFREASHAVRESKPNLPPGLNWDRMSAEMTGNIRVGLAAGEAVRRFGIPQEHHPWRIVAAYAVLCCVVTAAWFLNMPASTTASLKQAANKVFTLGRPVAVEPGVTLEGGVSSIAVKENGRALSLLYPTQQPVRVSVSLQGSMAARYVDSDTGQVTITNVYAQ